MSLHESASAHVDAPPEAVLRVVTSVSRLPEWNPAITDVIDVPEHLEPGTVWKVRLHALGQSWVSTSTVVALDTAAGRFAYRSQSDDGNPSYADWEWHVKPDGDGSRVTVAVDLHPLSFWRKHLLLRIRRPVLRKEMQRSVAALGSVAGS